MKTIFNLIISLILFLPIHLTAREITESEALLKARKFEQYGITSYKNIKQHGKTAPLKLTYTCKESGGSNLYYVFNRGENKGFIIVSGDDRANDILGYSDSGTFDYENLPPNMKQWLDIYKNDLNTLVNNSDLKTIKNVRTAGAFTQSVAPLLGDIKWGQGSPYNDLCPTLPDSKKSASGCVATAMAQVMYYHQWPPKGNDFYRYHSSSYGFNVSANFGDTYYEWDKIAPQYDLNSSPESKHAVATLMLHCGVSVEMDYGPSSGAYQFFVPHALTYYFNYDQSISMYKRNFHNIDEWMDIIKTELNEKRPVLYGGVGPYGGHAFVCDGYDANNMFHINWGWSGVSNGYYQLSALNPYFEETGGSTNSGYNLNQDLITRIQKQKGTTKINFNACCKNIQITDYTTLPRNNTFIIETINLGNYSWMDGLHYYALGLYDKDNLVQVLGKPFGFNLIPFYFINKVSTQFTIPKPVPAGNYRIYPIYQAPDSKEWQKVRVEVGQNKYIEAKITESYITLSDPKQYKPALQITNIEMRDKVYKNRFTKITFDISNTGGDFYGPINLTIYNISEDIPKQESTQIVDINSNTSTKVSFYENFLLDEGKYIIKISDIDGNQIGDSKEFTLLSAPPSSILKLKSTPYFPDNNRVPKNDINFTVKVENTGGLYSNNLLAIVSSINENIADKNLIAWSEIETGETKDIVFTGTMEDYPDGEYMLNIYSFSDEDGYSSPVEPKESQGVRFTLYSPSGSSESIVNKPVNIYPNPATSIINIENDSAIKNITIYDISGNQIITFTPQAETTKATIDINGINRGCYFVKITDTLGVKVKQLIKQ